MTDSMKLAPSARRLSPLTQLVLARIREFYREPEAIFWVYGFPLLMVTALGVAFRNKPVERSNVDICERPGAEAVLALLSPDERFNAAVRPEVECFQRLRTGKADLVIVQNDSTQLTYEYHFDPTKPGSLVARDAADNLLQRAAGRQDAATTSTIEHTEPGGRYIDFLVPGLLGMGLMGGGLWGLGFVVVDMRIRSLLKRFLATPMKKIHFLAALMISRMLGMILEVVLLLVFSRFVFGVEMRGSLAVVVLLILLGSVMFAGIGLLVACRAKTLEAVSGLMNLVMLPMWVLSGIFFSAERFPDTFQPLIRLLPLTALIDSLRAVMLDGAGLDSLTSEVAIMAVWTAASFALALRWFRWV